MSSRDGGSAYGDDETGTAGSSQESRYSSRTSSPATANSPSKSGFTSQSSRGKRWTNAEDAELKRLTLEMFSPVNPVDYSWTDVSDKLRESTGTHRSPGAIKIRWGKISDSKDWREAPAWRGKKLDNSEMGASGGKGAAGKRKNTAARIADEAEYDDALAPTSPALATRSSKKAMTGPPPWTEDEDSRLAMAILLRGENDWTSVFLDFLPSKRSIDDIREHWHGNLRERFEQFMAPLEYGTLQPNQSTSVEFLANAMPSKPHPKILAATAPPISKWQDSLLSKYFTSLAPAVQASSDLPAYPSNTGSLGSAPSPPPPYSIAPSPPAMTTGPPSPSPAPLLSLYDQRSPPRFPDNPMLDHMRAVATHQPGKPSPLSHSTTSGDLEQQQRQQQQDAEGRAKSIHHEPLFGAGEFSYDSAMERYVTLLPPFVPLGSPPPSGRAVPPFPVNQSNFEPSGYPSTSPKPRRSSLAVQYRTPPPSMVASSSSQSGSHRPTDRHVHFQPEPTPLGPLAYDLQPSQHSTSASTHAHDYFAELQQAEDDYKWHQMQETALDARAFQHESGLQTPDQSSGSPVSTPRAPNQSQRAAVRPSSGRAASKTAGERMTQIAQDNMDSDSDEERGGHDQDASPLDGQKEDDPSLGHTASGHKTPNQTPISEA